MNSAGEHVTITEITDLIAWDRRLSAAGPGTPSPAELAATEKGEALYLVLLALMEWGDRWYAGDAAGPASPP